MYLTDILIYFSNQVWEVKTASSERRHEKQVGPYVEIR